MLQRSRHLHHHAIFTQNCFQYETKQTVIWIQPEISGIVSYFHITHPGSSTWNRLLAQGTVGGGWKISSLFGGSNFTKACGAGSKLAVSASRRIVTKEWEGSRWRGYRSMQLSITFKLSHITHKMSVLRSDCTANRTVFLSTPFYHRVLPQGRNPIRTASLRSVFYTQDELMVTNSAW
jgi:hypothetical protein